MADDETPMAEPTDEAAVAEPVAPEQAPAQEPPVEDAPAADEPIAEGPPAEDPGAADEPVAADEPLAEDAAAEPPAAVAAPPEPLEILHPKERRRRARQRSSATPRPASTPEERKAERDALRAKNAKARADRRRKLRERKPAATQAAVVAATHEPGTQKVRQGVVVSDKAAKTITVRIDTSRRHRRYQKIVRSSKTLHAHDENNEAHEGDLVKVIETRPLSATKRWRLAEVLERAR